MADWRRRSHSGRRRQGCGCRRTSNTDWGPPARLHTPNLRAQCRFRPKFRIYRGTHCRDPIRLYRNVNIYITIYIQNYLFILHLIFH